MEIKQITVEKNGERADVYLASALDFTRSRIKKLLDEGFATIDGKAVKPRDILKQGEVVLVQINEPTNLEVKAVDIPLDIVYEDGDVAVINKQQGLTVHAGSGTDDNTLVNALLYRLDSLSGINGVIRPGIVHRIDKDTSGLLVVAKNDKAHLSLANQISSKTCKRVYVALLEGNLKSDSGVVDTFIDRSTKNRTMMAVSNSGRNAVTEYKVLKRFEGYTLCEFSLKTGRTHQIRVHAKHLGHPVVGDMVYGFKSNKFKLNGQLLHAKELSFVHPTTNELVTFTAPLPNYFEEVLKKIKKI
ncbi:MAG: RluA family pseudouridine synthase [Clostridia bacterium]|nr:RluA family pseudouridine synthase [Clostridia bacterium]